MTVSPTARLQLWQTHPHFRKVFLDERLGQMAAELAEVCRPADLPTCHALVSLPHS